MDFLAPTARQTLPTTGSYPTISIVVPCYQAAGTVGSAVASALAQTYGAHEVLVVDDGSRDEIDRALAPYLDRIRVIRKENGGAASARNAGTLAASGDFVVVLDADDVYHPDRLEAIANLASERPDLDLVTTDAYVERDGVRLGRLFHLNHFNVDNQRLAILQTNFVGAWPATRRERILGIGGYDESEPVAHDWDLAIRLILDGSLAGTVDEPLMTYRRHADSLSGEPIAAHRAAIRMLDKTRSNPSLSRKERAVLGASIKRKRRRLASDEMAADARSSCSRRTMLKHAVARHAAFRVRLSAVRVALVRPRAEGRD